MNNLDSGMRESTSRHDKNGTTDFSYSLMAVWVRESQRDDKTLINSKIKSGIFSPLNNQTNPQGIKGPPKISF